MKKEKAEILVAVITLIWLASLFIAADIFWQVGEVTENPDMLDSNGSSNLRSNGYPNNIWELVEACFRYFIDFLLIAVVSLGIARFVYLNEKKENQKVKVKRGNKVKKVVDVCPFMGITWEDKEGNIYYKGDGLTQEENERIDAYFAKFFGLPFDRDKAIELAQMAIDGTPIPEGWKPKEIQSKNKNM